MFLDDAKQVFILKLSIWRPESENREKIQKVLIPVTAFPYKFKFEALQNGAAQDVVCYVTFRDFNE